MKEKVSQREVHLGRVGGLRHKGSGDQVMTALIFSLLVWSGAPLAVSSMFGSVPVA